MKFAHVIIPVELKYDIPLARRISIVPGAGLGASFNLSQRINSEIDNYYTSGMIAGHISSIQSGDNFTNNHNRISYWGIAEVAMYIKISDRLGLTAGPSQQFMITSLTNSNAGFNQYNNLLLMNAGVNYFFGRKKATPIAAAALHPENSKNNN